MGIERMANGRRTWGCIVVIIVLLTAAGGIVIGVQLLTSSDRLLTPRGLKLVRAFN